MNDDLFDDKWLDALVKAAQKRLQLFCARSCGQHLRQFRRGA